MKNTIVVIIAAVLLLGSSACGLLNDISPAASQSKAVSTVGDSQDDTAGTNASNSENGSLAAGPIETGSSMKTGEEASAAATSPQPASKVKTAKVALYFATQDGTALKKEEREIQVYDGAILKACILALADGPKTEGLVKTIPDGTVLRGISIHDKVATVDFSEDFAVSGMAGVAARMSVVNTLTRISGIEKVNFHINGEEMKGDDGELLGAISPLSPGTSAGN